MTTINKSTRDLMVNAVLRHRYAEKSLALKQKGRDLFWLVYNTLHSTETKEAMMALLALNDKALVRTNNFYIRANGKSMEVHIDGRGYGAKLTADTVPPANPPPILHCYSWRVDDTFETGSAVADATFELEQEQDQFVEEIEVAKAQLTAAFNAMNTVKKLTAQWPEVLPLVEQYLPSPANRNLPTIPVIDLNAKFGLPPEAKE